MALCHEWHEGPYCAVCAADHYHDGDGRCTECGPCISQTYLAVGVVCGVLLLLALTLVALRRRVMRVGGRLMALVGSSGASTLMDYALTDAPDRDSNHRIQDTAPPRSFASEGSRASPLRPPPLLSTSLLLR